MKIFRLIKVATASLIAIGPVLAVPQNSASSIGQLRQLLAQPSVTDILIDGEVTHDGGSLVNIPPGKRIWFNEASLLDANFTHNAFQFDEYPVFTSGKFSQIFINTVPRRGTSPLGAPGVLGGSLNGGGLQANYPSIHGHFGGQPVEGAWFGLSKAPVLDPANSTWQRTQSAIDAGPMRGAGGIGYHRLRLGKCSLNISSPLNLTGNWVDIEGAGRDITNFAFDVASGSVSGWPGTGFVLASNTSADGAGFQSKIRNISVSQSGLGSSLFWANHRFEEGSELSDITIYGFQEVGFDLTGEGFNCATIRRIHADTGTGPSDKTLFRLGANGNINIEDIWVNTAAISKVFSIHNGSVYISRVKSENCGTVIHVRGGSGAHVYAKDVKIDISGGTGIHVERYGSDDDTSVHAENFRANLAHGTSFVMLNDEYLNGAEPLNGISGYRNLVRFNRGTSFKQNLGIELGSELDPSISDAYPYDKRMGRFTDSSDPALVVSGAPSGNGGTRVVYGSSKKRFWELKMY